MIGSCKKTGALTVRVIGLLRISTAKIGQGARIGMLKSAPERSKAVRASVATSVESVSKTTELDLLSSLASSSINSEGF
ncbi:hypothetical protein M407DRAFT_242190 [Tulasnella calospora MUT 4182]|uniref:Uncharacterized protein n=1 Tax=Tulasnella calospora MUT 4182 TaxID=1051891 RepID=A0A0C3QFY4_9AGAM|nr:hypothetical protein M407DRAFT_242190 [Tulasnella calospora MUT 4182]